MHFFATFFFSLRSFCSLFTFSDFLINLFSFSVKFFTLFARSCIRTSFIHSYNYTFTFHILNPFFLFLLRLTNSFHPFFIIFFLAFLSFLASFLAWDFLFFILFFFSCCFFFYSEFEWNDTLETTTRSESGKIILTPALFVTTVAYYHRGYGRGEKVASVKIRFEDVRQTTGVRLLLRRTTLEELSLTFPTSSSAINDHGDLL